MCSVVRVMSEENVYIMTCTQTYCMNWDWLEWRANVARVKLQLVMMSVYVYCIIKVITWYTHTFQATYVMHAWWSNTFRYLHIWCILVTNLGVIWLDSHNFLLWSHGRLLSMKSLVRVLPAAAYTFNMVPIYDPGGPNPHGRVWETFPVPVRDFTPRSHYPREAGLPKPDFRSRTLIRRRTHSELGYLPIRLKSTRSYSLNQSVHY